MRYAELIFSGVLGSAVCFLLKKLSAKLPISIIVAFTLRTCCDSVKLTFVR